MPQPTPEIKTPVVQMPQPTPEIKTPVVQMPQPTPEIKTPVVQMPETQMPENDRQEEQNTPQESQSIQNLMGNHS